MSVPLQGSVEGGSSRTDQVVSGVAWMGASAGGRVLVQVIILATLARLLGPEEFGLASAALVVIGLSEVLARLGLGQTLIQRPEIETRHVRTAVGLSLGVGALLSVAVFASASLVGDFFRMPELEAMLRILALALPVSAVGTVAAALLQRDLRFGVVARIELFGHLFGYGFMGIASALAGLGVWALVIGELGRTAFNSAFYWAATSSFPRPALEWRAIRELVWFGSGFTLARWANAAANQADNLVVGRFLGAEALGAYGRAYSLMVLPASVLGQAADRVLFSAMARIQDDSEKLAAAFLRATRIAALGALPLSVVSFLLAPEIVYVLLGDQWGDTIPPFQAFAFVMLLRTTHKLSDSYARAVGMVYRRAWRQGIYALAVGAGALAGYPYGVVGVAWGVSAAVAVNYYLMTGLTVRTLPMAWGDVLTAHGRAALVAVVVLVEVAPVAFLARANGLGDISTLVLSLALPAVTVGVVLLIAPRLLLGSDVALPGRLWRALSFGEGSAEESDSEPRPWEEPGGP